MNKETMKRWATALYFKAGLLIDKGDVQNACGALLLSEYNYGKADGIISLADQLVRNVNR